MQEIELLKAYLTLDLPHIVIYKDFNLNFQKILIQIINL